LYILFFFSSRRRHTRSKRDWSSDVCSSDLIELFVLDDGWFGKRDDDTTSLGDWFIDRAKLPNGLKKLSEAIHDKGMQFGLWFEPEMISEESELYKKHPEIGRAHV